MRVNLLNQQADFSSIWPFPENIKTYTYKHIHVHTHTHTHVLPPQAAVRDFSLFLVISLAHWLRINTALPPAVV